MISIHTNISSLIAQNSLNQSTNRLNTAIERMTTGYKINHAADNAANYSIALDMSVKISAYSVAEDNAALGLDMIDTANSALDEIARRLERVRDLAMQAANGTYGGTSLDAINQEAQGHVSEIMRLYSTTEYNGCGLFSDTTGGGSTPPPTGGFVNSVTPQDTSSVTALPGSVPGTLAAGTYKISTVDDLKNLATYVNAGKVASGCTFVLANDIDISGEEWTPIGNSTNKFTGIFDGNGHEITGLKTTSGTYRGLFGFVTGTVKNLGVNRATIGGGNYTGALVGRLNGGTVDNCYAKAVTVTGTGNYTGGLVGQANGGNVKNSCIVGGSVSSSGTHLGGLIGSATNNAKIDTCYSSISVSGTSASATANIGGLVGYLQGNSGTTKISNSYATGSVTAENAGRVGGLVGEAASTTLVIENCYAAGSVKGKTQVGGLVGHSSQLNATNCYATGNVTGNNNVGGFIGNIENVNTNAKLNNCYATGDVSSSSDNVGGFSATMTGTITTGDSGTVIGCYFTGTVTKNGVVHSDDNAAIDNRSSSGGGGGGGTPSTGISLQVGIYSDDSSKISVNTGINLGDATSLMTIGLDATDYLTLIDDILTRIYDKQTSLGAVQNRVESAVDEIQTHYNNLVSSRSTLKDADIAKVSSEYVKQQILQQASSTLLSTANQTPSIALMLL